MRVLHLLASPVFSGPAELVLELARAQRVLGCEVQVAVDRTRAGTGTEEGIVPRFAEAALLDGGGLGLSTRSGPFAFLADARRLRRRALDVVHAHTSHDHLLGRVGRPAGAVLVRSLHAPRSVRWFLPRADGFTVPFAGLLGRVRPPAQVLPALVRAGFEPARDRVGLRKRLQLPGPGPVVGMVSTFQPSRRHALALDAFALLRGRGIPAHLVLVGDGVLEPALRSAVARLGLERAVTFAGYQLGRAFVEWVQALDEVWLLGLGNDWSARAAVQARRCGVRVVAACEGALPEWADATVNPLTPEALAAVALRGDRRERGAPSSARVAEDVLALYRAAGARV